MKRFAFILLATLGLAACNSANQSEGQEEKETEKQVVNIYSHRHYDVDKELFSQFEEETGIEVNVVKAKANELIERLKREGENSSVDLFITADAGNLAKAAESGLLQPYSSSFLEKTVPQNLKDVDNRWYAITKRARVIAYSKDRVDPSELSTYASLTDDQWKDRVLIRSSSNIYNQSLMASIIAHEGEEKAKTWASGIVDNMARDPQGGDRDQVFAIVAGEGDVAVINTYYMGLLLNSPKEEERKAAEQTGIFFPNQDGRGTHINVSGAGLVKYSPNKENAIKLIEFLLSEGAQEKYAQANYEYPVNPAVEPAETLQKWGDFKEDSLQLSKLGEFNREAVMIFNEVGWK
jgi:iron(III) transport system substrate-binding protein